MRTIVSTGTNSRNHTYLIRSSTLVAPWGVSTTGVKFNRSCRIYSPRFAAGMASMSAREGAITTPNPANEYSGLSTKFSRSDGISGSRSRNHVRGTDGCFKYGIEYLLIWKYQFGC